MAPLRANNKNNVSSSSTVRASKIQKQRKKHKVVLETSNNDNEDDKLRVVLSFHADPPPGFTFIPAGNTQLTAALKSFAKRGGHKIMAVSATPHASRHELSREVHRIGYHFPTEVIDQVCSHYGIRIDRAGRVIGEQDNHQLFMKISQKGEVVLNETVRDQVTINTEAKEIIRDLFPKIPDNDLFQIIKTAFQLGDKKVGTAEEIPLVRRAQLSVVAHIRHSYTNYDKLLRQVPYNEARHMVEKTTLRKLVEWRGDENDQTAESKKAVDEAVREVVVLSDEEDSDSELEEGQVLEKNDVRVEPGHKPSRPEVTTQHRPVSPGELSSGEDAPRGYRYVSQPSRRNPLPQAEQDMFSRRQQSRYALWDQVRHEYQNGIPTQEAPRVIARIPLNNPAPIRHVTGTRDLAYDSPSTVRYLMEDPQPVRIMRQPSPPRVFRGADGRLYERVPAYPDEMSTQPRRIYTPPTRVVTMPDAGRRSASPRAARSAQHRRTPSTNEDGSIMPSIEQPDTGYNSPDLRRHGFDHPQRREDPARHDRYRDRNLIDLTSSAEKATERMRLSPSPPPSPYGRGAQNPSRDVEMSDFDPLPRHRQLIELDHQLPSPSSSARSTFASHGSRLRDDPIPRSPQRLPNDNLLSRHEVHAQPGDRYHPFMQRQVIYEPVDDQPPPARQTHYVIDDAMTALDNRQDQRYYVLEDDRHQRVMHQTYRAGDASRLVSDSLPPVDFVRRPMDPRQQPPHRTTYVRH